MPELAFFARKTVDLPVGELKSYSCNGLAADVPLNRGRRRLHGSAYHGYIKGCYIGGMARRGISQPEEKRPPLVADEM